VLITLSIIGVIAAITIPSLIANHQKTTLETQFAKMYRNLSHVVNMAIAEHGAIDTWDWKNEQYTEEEMNNFVKKYFAPNLNIIKFCPAGGEAGCFQNPSYTTMKGTIYSINMNDTTRPSAVLADGTMARFNFNTTSGYRRSLTFQVDINGAKKPNALGRDLFFFAFYPESNDFVPFGIYKVEEDNTLGKNSREDLENNCINQTGDVCTALMVMDGFKMNY